MVIIIRKLLPVVLALCMVLVACGQNEQVGSASTPEAEQSESVSSVVESSDSIAETESDIEETPEPEQNIPLHKTGQFRDMDVPSFLAEIGPGYSETHLAECNATIGYDKSYQTASSRMARTIARQYSDQKHVEIPDLSSEWFAHLKSEGFRSIRFQVTWFNHTNDETYQIEQAWLARVEELVNLAMEQDLYCLININWDMSANYRDTHGIDEDRPGWLTLDGEPEVEERFAAVWQQIAEYFKDYDEHLFFESMNEPLEEEYSQHDAPDEILSNLNRLNQIFVDSVRDTGGNNAQRFLLVPPYFGRGAEHNLTAFVLPDDPANHTVVSMNSYMDDFADDAHEWTPDSNNNPFIAIEKYLAPKGIGVVFTEAGSEINAHSIQSRIDFTRYFVAEADRLHIPIIYYGSDSVYDDWWFRLYDWKTYEPFQPEIIAILMGQ